MKSSATVKPFRLTIALAACLLALPSISSLLADWPLYRGNPDQTGVAAGKLPDKLEVRWKIKLPRGIGSTAAIVGGVAYVGCYDEHLYAFDLNTGKEKWKFHAGSFKAAPSVFEGAVYIGDEDGAFWCIDAAAGTKRWSVEIDATITGGANFAGDLVFVGAHDSTLYAFHRANGKPAWKYKTKQGPIYGSAVVAKGFTFLAGCDSNLHVVDVKTGKGVAQIELGGQSGSTAAFHKGMLYVPTNPGELDAIDLAKHKVAWTFTPDDPQAFSGSAAVTDKRVIAGNDDGNVYALDQNGKPAWTFATKKGRVESSPVIAAGRVYAGTTGGALFVLDLEKGRLIQKMQLGKGITASPAISDNCLVIGTTDGMLYCLGTPK